MVGEPHEVEDILCIFKDELKNVSAIVRTDPDRSPDLALGVL